MKVVIISDSPLCRARVHGGLQATFQLLLPSLANRFPTTLFCGHDSDDWPGVAALYRSYDSGASFIPAFGDPFLAETRDAGLVISLETPLPAPVPSRTLLIMGGMAYDWSTALARSRRWDLVVVPSEDARRRSGMAASPSMRVIANGYDAELYRPMKAAPPEAGPAEAAVRIIHPHRPEDGKGAMESWRLTEALLRVGVDCRLFIPEQGFFTSDSGFYSRLKALIPDALRDRVVFHPWLDLPAMPAYYSMAHLTLALGSVPEGFGATIIESIACGTPVLATRRGAVAGLLPQGHGLYIAGCADLGEMLSVARGILDPANPAAACAVARGRAYVAEHYSRDTMISRYHEAIDELLEGGP